MESPIEATRAQGARKVAVTMQKAARQSIIAAEERGSDQWHRHHLSCRKAGLHIITVLHAFEQIITQAVNRDYGILHGSLLMG